MNSKRIVKKIAYLCISAFCLFALIFTPKLLATQMLPTQSLKSCVETLSKKTHIAIGELKVVNCAAITTVDGLEELKSLEDLTFSNLQLTVLPASLQKVPKLSSLTITNSNLKKIPEEIYKLKNLKSLNLTNNELLFVAPEIGNLASLEKLHLGGNKLKYLPEEVLKLTKLSALSASTNRLIRIPDLQNLKALSYLNVDNNQLSELPDLSAQEMIYVSAEKNLLKETTISTLTETFSIKQTYKIEPTFKNMTIQVGSNWSNMEEDVARSVQVSNGTTPFGYAGYQLTDLINSQGEQAQLTQYLDANNRVIKNDTVHANVALLDNKNSNIAVTTEKIKIVFYNENLLLPPVLPEIPNNPDTSVPPIGESRPMIRPENNQGTIITGEPRAVEGANQMLTISNPATTEGAIFPSVWQEFLLANQGVRSNNWTLYEIVSYFILNMAFGFIAILPIIAIGMILKNILGLHNTTESILYTKKIKK